MRVSLSVLSLILAGGIALTGIPSEAKGKAGVTYKAAPDATLNYADGVTVHRHSDGSVEVGDSASAPEPLYPNQGRPAVRRVVHKRAVARKAVTTTAKTTTTTKTSTAKKTK
jgi:hypothetical protein